MRMILLRFWLKYLNINETFKTKLSSLAAAYPRPVHSNSDSCGIAVKASGSGAEGPGFES